MNPREYREFLEAYQSVYEQQIGVPLKDASDRAAKQQLQKMIPKGEKVYTPKTTLQKAHYEPDGDLVDEMNAGPSTPVKIDPKMGVVPNQGATRVGKVRLKPGTPASSLIKLADSCEPEGELTEDLEERKKQLAQKRREQIAGFRERISDRVKANRKRLEKRREREELKSEIKSELAREAVGDPINPNSVFRLNDPETQRNLKSAAKPAGPAPMKPKVEKKPQQPSADRFVKRMVGSTMLSPL